MNKTVIAIVAATALIASVGVGGYLYWTGGPSYVLKQAVDSFKSKNKAQFENYVDIDSVIDSMVDDVLSSAFQDTAANSKSGFEAMGGALGMKLVEAFKPQIRAMVKEKILTAFDKDLSKSSSQEEDLGKTKKAKKIEGVQDLLAVAEDGKVEFLGLGETNESGNTAIIPINFRHKVYEKEFALEIKLSKVEGSWRITHIRKVGEMMSKLKQWETAYLNKLNAPIIEKMNKAISVSGLKKQNQSDQWGINRKSIITVGFQNTSDKKINRFVGQINIVNASGESIKSFPLDIKNPLGPGKTFNGQVAANINQFMKDDVRLYKIPQENMKAQLVLEQVSFGDESELKLHKDVLNRLPSGVE